MIGRPVSRTRLLSLAAGCCVCQSVSAQVPVADLAQPPPDALHLVILSASARHGDSWMWVTPDGTRMGRDSMHLRGQDFEFDSSGKADAHGMPATWTIRGSTPQGDAGETFAVRDGVAHWTSPIDSGSAPVVDDRFYVPEAGALEATTWLVERLLATPDHRLPLWPSGEAPAIELAMLVVGSGADRKTITSWGVTGLGTSPQPIWADADGRFFAYTPGIDWIPDAYVADQQRMHDAQTAGVAAQGPIIAKLATTPVGSVAITHVRTFDADHLRFLADQTVVVARGRIVAVGAASRIKVPVRARRIDGRGMTLVPGLWDCHMHVSDDYTGPQELSMGVTSIRDPGNDDRQTMDRRARIAAGRLLFPHVYPSSLIDGPGPYTAQVAHVAHSEAETIAFVDAAKQNGFTAVKFYGSLDPAWLPAAIARAHQLGLHVHGHIPHGIRPLVAIDDGYDEVTHLNWVMMQAMPEETLATDNGLGRMEVPARYAKDVDLDGRALTDIVSVMANRHIVSDPTMVVFESLFVPDNGDLSPAYAPFVGTLPPAAERGFRAGGFAVPKDLTRADYRASYAKFVGLLKKMHEAGVPIVAGTDGSGIEIIRELEIYVEAGFTPAEALAAATIVPARLVGQEQRTGSIRVGKVADLALVEGDPSVRIGHLRQTRVVVMDGRVMEADALREAAGFSGRPRKASLQ